MVKSKNRSEEKLKRSERRGLSSRKETDSFVRKMLKLLIFKRIVSE